MRIISGFLRGKSINYLKNDKTRPLKDSVKENIFNILSHSNLINIKIKNSNVLDLYSGIGSFGLECISRNAKKATFIEKERDAADILKNNLIKLSLTQKGEIINHAVENALNSIKVEKFNIFFFDPPFLDKTFITILDQIKNQKIYYTQHIVIVHRERKTEDNLEKHLKIIFTKQYGRSKIIFGTFN
jgi:16S rRNA (guanine966-N2)-methyltransferase